MADDGDDEADPLRDLRTRAATLTEAQARSFKITPAEEARLSRRVTKMLDRLSPHSELGRAWERLHRTRADLRRRRWLRSIRYGQSLASLLAGGATGGLVHHALTAGPAGLLGPLDRLVAAPDSSLLGDPTFVFGFLAGQLAVTALVLLNPRTRAQSAEVTELRNAPVEVFRARHALDSILRNEITFLARDLHEFDLRAPADDVVVIGRADDIATRVMEDVERLPVDAIRQVQAHLIRRGGAVLGIYGERGSGKSELIRALCAKDSAGSQPVIGVFVAAPTATDIDAFLRLVVTEACASVPGFTPPDGAHRLVRRLLGALLGLALAGAGVLAMARDGWPAPSRQDLGLIGFAVGVVGFLVAIGTVRMTRHVIGGCVDVVLGASRQLDVAVNLRASRDAARREAQRLHHEVRHLETLSSHREAALGATGSTITLGSGRTSEALPLTSTDLVARLRRLASLLHGAGYRIVVGIDELDRLEAGEQTDAFLNGIKQLFTTPHVSYLVSISDSAWTEFAQRDVNVRGVLDSSFDDIVTIEPLDHFCARALIRRRGEERITDTQVLLCLALSGGLPRELLRQCRAMAAASSGAARTRRLADVADHMVRQEWRDHVRAATKVVLTWDASARRSDLLVALDCLGDLRRAGDRIVAIPLDASWDHAAVARRLLTELAALARLLVVVADVFGRSGRRAHQIPWTSTVAMVGKARRAIGEDARTGLLLLEKRFPERSATAS